MNGLGSVLFDLDGTLLDTAPDMVDALNRLCGEEAQDQVPISTARRYVSNGARGLVNMAFGDPAEADRDRLIARFLVLYEERLSRETGPFAGMNDLLELLENASVPWGIVTNKPAYLTEPLLEQQGLTARAACIVSGDTIPQRKPDPGPIYHAVGQLGDLSGPAVYVGDSSRDIEAGSRAGLYTAAVCWGYILPGENPEEWGADFVAETPAALANWLAELSAAG